MKAHLDFCALQHVVDERGLARGLRAVDLPDAPAGTPPMPSARSSDSAPVGIASQRTCAPSSPIRMTVPLPNSRSICVSAPWRAASRALAAFSSSVTGMVLLLGSCWSGQSIALPGRHFRKRGPKSGAALRLERLGGERLVGGALRVKPGAVQRERPRREAQLGRRRARHLPHGPGRVSRPRSRATVRWARKRRCPGCQSTARASAALSSRCRWASSPLGSWISTASARGWRGGSHSGAPTDSSPALPEHEESASESVWISSTGRLPRKHSVICRPSSSSTRSSGRGSALRPRPGGPGGDLAATVRAQPESSWHTSAGGSTATNSRALARARLLIRASACAEYPPQQVHRDGGGTVAHAAAPGRSTRRVRG
jgi:hypothetical protein